MERAEVSAAAELKAKCAEHNRALLRNLRDDEHGADLLQAAIDDTRLGRMVTPKRAAAADTGDVLLNPRFGVLQSKPDGSQKFRPIDSFSWSPVDPELLETCEGKRKRTMLEGSVNGHTSAGEELRHDTLDTLAETMVEFEKATGCVPGLLKVGARAADVLLRGTVLWNGRRT